MNQETPKPKIEQPSVETSPVAGQDPAVPAEVVNNSEVREAVLSAIGNSALKEGESFTPSIGEKYGIKRTAFGIRTK